ncbi:hypothetical protein BH20ACT22_BH20ACT22_22640 [soil metagenome]
MGALLHDQVAIITGGAMGIGEGCARVLSEQGRFNRDRRCR